MSYQLHITSTAEHDIMRAVVMQILTASESSFLSESPFLISFFLSFPLCERKKGKSRDVETNVLSIKKNAQKSERNLYYPNFLRMLSNCVFVISSFSV